LLKNNPPELVRLAAERGLKACQAAWISPIRGHLALLSR
jgi:hypothetical protein